MTIRTSRRHGLVRRATMEAMEYEFQRFSLPRSISRSAVRRLLVDHAEYGGWELARLRLFPDGSRKVELRRKIIRVRSTLGADLRPYV